MNLREKLIQEVDKLLKSKPVRITKTTLSDGREVVHVVVKPEDSAYQVGEVGTSMIREKLK